MGVAPSLHVAQVEYPWVHPTSRVGFCPGPAGAPHPADWPPAARCTPPNRTSSGGAPRAPPQVV